MECQMGAAGTSWSGRESISARRAALSSELTARAIRLDWTRPAQRQQKANESLDNLNGLLTDARPKVAASLTNVQELTARMSPLLDDLKATTARANETLGHVDATLAENRPDIRATVTGLRDTLARSTLLLNELNQTVEQNSSNIDGLLENMRMTTENLKALTETLTHSPASLIRGMKVADRKPGEVAK